MIIKDQVNRTLSLEKAPVRIISCVPSITEILFEFNPAGNIIGRTKFCIHPKPQIQQIPIIGGTKNLRLEEIKARKPDLIFANKEENQKDQIEELAKEFPCYVSDIPNVENTCAFIADLGLIFSKEDLAKRINQNIRKELNSTLKIHPVTALYLIWQKPYMSIGNDTYIHNMLMHSKFSNILGHKSRYPKIDIQEINQYKPEVILFSSEPFPFKQKHMDELQDKLDYTPKMLLVDGEMLSWYGARTQAGLEYGRKLRLSLTTTEHS